MLQETQEPKSDQKNLFAFTTFYLSIPGVLFAYGWLRFPYSLVTILLIIFCMSFAVIDFLQAIAWKKLFSKQYIYSLIGYKTGRASIALTFIVLVVWSLLSGVGGFGFQNFDYKKHNAVLMSLINQNWPPRVTKDAPLVYYIGYYLPAAGVGKLVGWDWANIFIVFWTFIGVVLSFVWFCKISNVDIKKSITIGVGSALIFCLAGGLDVIGSYVLMSNNFDSSVQVERWAKYFQYSSQTTLMFWVPQHAIVGWLLTGMIVYSFYHPQRIKFLGLALGFGILWSPFSVIGTIPFLILLLFVYFAKQNRGYLFDRTSIIFHLSALWIGGINLLYILSNRYEFPVGFLWNVVDREGFFIVRWLEFWLIEFGFLTLVILLFFILGKRSIQVSSQSGSDTWLGGWLGYLKDEFDLTSKQVFLVFPTILVLTILPIFKMGRANDLVMRASIPALFILWALVSKVAIDASPSIKRRFRVIFITLIITIVVGFYPAAENIARSINAYHFGPPAASSVDTIKKFDVLNAVHQLEGTESSIFYNRLIKK